MGEETFHPDTRALLAYGRALAGAGTPPKKGGADQVLERLFVIERKSDNRLPIRTFGTELVNLFGADLRDHDFARFFLAPDLAMLHALIGACSAAGEPGIPARRSLPNRNWEQGCSPNPQAGKPALQAATLALLSFALLFNIPAHAEVPDYKLGDAARVLDPEDPNQGLVFDGRVTEDFKLDSGTWVSVGTLRLHLVTALAPLAQDAVITGHDRNEIGALVFLSEAARQLPPDDVRSQVQAALRRIRPRAVVRRTRRRECCCCRTRPAWLPAKSPTRGTSTSG